MRSGALLFALFVRFRRAQLVCRGFGYHEDAGAWRVGHLRFVADITGDGRVDIVGFGGPGVYVARNQPGGAWRVTLRLAGPRPRCLPPEGP